MNLINTDVSFSNLYSNQITVLNFCNYHGSKKPNQQNHRIAENNNYLSTLIFCN